MLAVSYLFEKKNEIQKDQEFAELTNKFFDDYPMLRKIAKVSAVTGAIILPGGLVILPAVLYGIDKKDAKKQKKKIEQAIKGMFNFFRK